jgi:hypothetical protein
LRDVTEVEWNLGKFTIRLEVIVLSKRIELLISIRVDELVAPVVVRLLLMLDPLSRS